MLVRELIEQLERCNPDSKVETHENPIMDLEFKSEVSYAYQDLDKVVLECYYIEEDYDEEEV